MREIRIGNDISVRVHVRHAGCPADFTGRKLRVQLVSGSMRLDISDFKVDGSTVAFTYKGTEQTRLGVYYVTLTESCGDGHQSVCDTHDAFRLVPRSPMTGGGYCGSGVQTAEASADVELCLDYGRLQGLPRLNGRTVEGDRTSGHYGLQPRQRRYVIGKYLKPHAPENVYVQARKFLNIRIPTGKRLRIRCRAHNIEHVSIFSAYTDARLYKPYIYDASKAEHSIDSYNDILSVFAPEQPHFGFVFLSAGMNDIEGKGLVGRRAEVSDDGTVEIIEEAVYDAAFPGSRKRIQDGKIEYSADDFVIDDFNEGRDGLYEDGYIYWTKWRRKERNFPSEEKSPITWHTRDPKRISRGKIKKKLKQLWESSNSIHVSFFRVYVSRMRDSCNRRAARMGPLRERLVMYDGEKYYIR